MVKEKKANAEGFGYKPATIKECSDFKPIGTLTNHEKYGKIMYYICSRDGCLNFNPKKCKVIVQAGTNTPINEEEMVDDAAVQENLPKTDEQRKANNLTGAKPTGKGFTRN